MSSRRALPTLVFAFLFGLGGIALATPVAAADAAVTQIRKFSPQGAARNVRQVTASFSQPMVAFGDLRAEAPFEIDCTETGTGHWIDSHTWVYDFSRDIPAGVRCSFEVRSNLQSLAGQSVEGNKRFSFSTGAPVVARSNPTDGDESIDEEQAFILVLDGPVDEESILRHAQFLVDGLPTPIGARLVSPEQRAAILATQWRDFVSGPTLILQARQRFPNDTRVRLVWSKKIRSPTGLTNEKDQILTFKTRPAFEAHVLCDRENARAHCVPLAPLRVSFSAPISRADATRIVLRSQDGHSWQPELDDGDDTVESVRFPAPFPESASLRLELPHDLRDDAGRSLLNEGDFPRTVKFAPFPPLAKFAARFGILEAKGDPALPVTVRALEPKLEAQLLSFPEDATQPTVSGQLKRISGNEIEAALPWLRAVAKASRNTSVFAQDKQHKPETSAFTLPTPASKDSTEVVGIPLSAPGLYIVELASRRLGRSLLGAEQRMYVQAAALVTNLAVHFKWGRDNAIAWVTRLDNAQPVDGALVDIRDCNGKLIWSGISGADGVAWITGLPDRNHAPGCYNAWPQLSEEEENDHREYVPALNALNAGLLVTARTSDDFSFVHSDWQDGIEPWRFQLPMEVWSGPLIQRTILDRTLFRAGETVHMRHLIRRQSLDGFSAVPEAERPRKAVIRHTGSDDSFEIPLTWNSDGSAESMWNIPPGAKLGRYSILLPDPIRQGWSDAATEFQVQEFRVPLMRGNVLLPGDPIIGGAELPVDLMLQYLNGGAAGEAHVVLRSQVRPGRFVANEEYEKYEFGNGPTATGISREGMPSGIEEKSFSSSQPGARERQELQLDSAGSLRAKITDVPLTDRIRELLVEMEYRDPNGETQTAQNSVGLWPADLLVGIRAEHWVSSPRSVRVHTVVLDRQRKPVSGAEVRVDALKRRLYSSRKRLVGGFYAYEDVAETTPAGTFCSGRTDTAGRFECEADAPAGGNLILQGIIRDSEGRESVAHTELWVNDESEWRFEGNSSDRIDLLPERVRYEPGETAKLQVRMPFREATALITIEREGIAEARVVPLTNTNPTVEVPILPGYAPNVFVSALVVRGRTGDVQPTAFVDLGRPAFKLGIAELRVGWQAHELKVAVTSDRDVYKVREQAHVGVHVRRADGSPPPPGSNIALAVVDEGLLELLPNRTWDLLANMMGRRPYSVQTATAQMQVVGKRHFGLKAVPQGGGGGRQGTRELFDTLLLWRGRVTLDASGDATIDVPLNDSLTSFRIAAVAVGGTDLFGTGYASIRSTQDLMVLSGLPRAVRTGDQFPAEFTVRNTSARDLEVRIDATVTGLNTLPEQRVQLAAGAATTVSWPITVPDGVEELQYEVHAVAAGVAPDRLRIRQSVSPLVPVQTLQATIERLDRTVEMPVAKPVGALPGRGGIALDLSARLAGSLESVRSEMQSYPYTCLEQLLSRAIALHDDEAWARIVALLPSYQDHEGFLKFFPSQQQGSDILTAYTLMMSEAAHRPFPNPVRQRLIAALLNSIAGRTTPRSSVTAVDLPLRKLRAIAALAMVGSAGPEMLQSLALDAPLLPLTSLVDWWTILDRIPNVAQRDERLREVEQLVRNRLDLRGSLLTVADESRENLWWLLDNADVAAARLLFWISDTGKWEEDAGRVARGLLARMKRGTWGTTTANAWGTVALDRFSERYEAVDVGGVTISRLDGTETQHHWSASAKNDDFLPWPPAESTLSIRHTGSGAPWVNVQSRAAIPSSDISSGYTIRRSWQPVEVKTPGEWHRGDVVRVRLEIEAQTDMTWAVVDDPLPPGTAHLAAGYGKESVLLGTQSTGTDLAQPTFTERGELAYRAYFEYLPKGTHIIEYPLRLNQPGNFHLPPTRVSALYAPELFGTLSHEPLAILP